MSSARKRLVRTHDARKGLSNISTWPDDTLASEAGLVQGLQRQTHEHEALLREVLEREKHGHVALAARCIRVTMPRMCACHLGWGGRGTESRACVPVRQNAADLTVALSNLTKV